MQSQGAYKGNAAAGNDLASQRLRVAQWFADRSSLTTEEARRELDVMHPAGRIRELRADGWQIVTFWERFPTAGGRLHRMARYVCMGLA